MLINFERPLSLASLLPKLTLVSALLAAGCGDDGLAPPTEYTLAVSVAGQATLSVEPGAEVCAADSDCTIVTTAEFVSIQAVVAAGHELVDWTGACADTAGTTCTLTLSGDVSLGVEIREIPTPMIQHEVRVLTNGLGSGSIASNPGGIDCPAGDCAANFAEGATVTLTATADEGSEFTGWSGDCPGSECTCTDTVCEISANVDHVVAANFSPIDAPEEHVLRTVVSGEGTLVSSPAGIDCPGDCAHQGTTIALTLTAAPSEGWEFGGWSGDCPGEGCECTGDTCTIDRALDTLVVATFSPIVPPDQHVLRALTTGSGTITSSPGGIDCPGDCEETGEALDFTLSATPDAGWEFLGWTGDCPGDGCVCTGDSCTVSRTVDTFVIANFGEIPPPDTATLRVATSGRGVGTITSTPAGIDCPGTCEYTTTSPIDMELLATPGAGQTFDGWGGDCPGAECTCTGDMCRVQTTSSVFAVATFIPVQWDLDVTLVGDGNVSASAIGLDCDATCFASLDHDTMVTLTATANTGSDFTGWTGACTGASATCMVTMDQARAVTATFTRRSYDVTISGTGSGMGTLAGMGLSCSATSCTGTFDYGTVLTITAAAVASSSTFTGWSGACASAGSNTTCTLTLTGATTTIAASAGFALQARSLTVATSTVRSGMGSVTSPVGIDCGSSCSYMGTHGDMVTLTAVPAMGSRFLGWTVSDGSCASLSLTCDLTLTADITVSAGFSGASQVLLSESDKDADGILRFDRLGVDNDLYGGLARSDTPITAGSGVYYVEAHRLTDPNAFGLGVSSATRDPENAYLGDVSGAAGIDTFGGILHSGMGVGSFTYRAAEYYGIVVDYRGASPTLYFIVEEDFWGSMPLAARVVQVEAMPEVTGDLYFEIGGGRYIIGSEIEVNPGNDTTNFPFHYDVDTVLRNEGYTDVADNLTMGWGQTYAGPANTAPSLMLGGATTVAAGTPVTVTAMATDAEDGDITADVFWELESSPYLIQRVTGSGASFTFTPTAVGRHVALARVTDSAGYSDYAEVSVTVPGPIAQYDPVQLATDPLAGAGIELSPDGLSTRWTANIKAGIRANQSIYGQFWYFEISRLVTPTNMGGGLMTPFGDLNPYDWATVPPSMSINVGGGYWWNLISQGSFPSDASNYTHYGFAVDYRGEYPIVYVIVGGAVEWELHMTDVHVEIYPMLYGNPTYQTMTGEYDEAINFGASAFTYDPTTALTNYGIDTTQFEAGWGDANTP